MSETHSDAPIKNLMDLGKPEGGCACGGECGCGGHGHGHGHHSKAHFQAKLDALGAAQQPAEEN